MGPWDEGGASRGRRGLESWAGPRRQARVPAEGVDDDTAR